MILIKPKTFVAAHRDYHGAGPWHLILHHYSTTVILTAEDSAQYSSGRMRKRFTCLVLVIGMACSAVSTGAHAGEGSCPMANMPDCCKKAQSADGTPAISMARLCCNLNCSEPGSSGANSLSSFANQQGSVANAAIIPSAALFHRLQFSPKTSLTTHLHDQSPKYIQHLA